MTNNKLLIHIVQLSTIQKAIKHKAKLLSVAICRHNICTKKDNFCNSKSKRNDNVSRLVIPYPVYDRFLLKLFRTEASQIDLFTDTAAILISIVSNSLDIRKTVKLPL